MVFIAQVSMENLLILQKVQIFIILDSISNLIKKWNEWRNFTVPNINYYKDKTLEELIKNEYHPFDEGEEL